MTNDLINLIYKESIDSTNLEARRILDTFRSNADIGAELTDSCTEGADSLFANRPFMVVAREHGRNTLRRGHSHMPCRDCCLESDRCRVWLPHRDQVGERHLPRRQEDLRDPL